MKIWTPNSCCTDNSWFFEYFYGFLGFLVWEISGHFGGVYQSRYCASDGELLFSFVYVMYLNIASYLCGKQIKSKLGNTMCLWMIFICVHLKRLGLNECCTRTLKTIKHIIELFIQHLLSQITENVTATTIRDKVIKNSKNTTRAGANIYPTTLLVLKTNIQTFCTTNNNSRETEP